MLPQWHVEDPGYSAKSAGGRLNLNTHTPLTQRYYAAVQAQCRNLSKNEVRRNLSGNTRPQSSKLADLPWTDPGIKTGISVHDLFPLKRKEEKAQAGNEWSNILPKILTRKKPPPPLSEVCLDKIGLTEKYNFRFKLFMEKYNFRF